MAMTGSNSMASNSNGFRSTQRNIGQMQIAMAAPHEPLLGSPLEQCLERRDMIVAAGIELIDGVGIQSMHLAEFCRVAVDDGRE